MNKSQKTPVPEFLKPYFWDVRFEDLDFEKFRTFVLKRVLDRGSTQAIRWIRQNYTDQEIERLLLTSRDISPKTVNFWALYLNVDIKKVPALENPPLRKMPVPLTSEYLNRAF